jgi:Zn-finger nucleic acid-binding protein
MVELERSGVRIDACRNCRGVFLDRGELDKVVAHERKLLDHDDDDDFMREVTGHRGGGHEGQSKYGFDARTAEKLFSDYQHHKSSHKKKRKKSILEEFLG